MFWASGPNRIPTGFRDILLPGRPASAGAAPLTASNKVYPMNATVSRFGKVLGSAAMICLAAASFYAMIWVIWDL